MMSIHCRPLSAWSFKASSPSPPSGEWDISRWLPFRCSVTCSLALFGVLITFLWIVGLTNAYNFMDGIDGMAGGVALVAALGWMWLSSDTQTWFVFWVALAIAASSLGFLGHNWSPAKVFMGDVGSTFLGYTFAVLSLVSANQSGDALLIGTLLMWTVIMDSLVTFLGRLIKRENVFTGHRSHLFQTPGPGGIQAQHHQSLLHAADRCCQVCLPSSGHRATRWLLY